MLEKYPTEEIKKFLSFCLTFERIIVLSPHLDDAVFSMGMLLEKLIEEKKNISIYNIFTKGSSLQTPLTKKLLRQSAFVDADIYFKMREREDKEAIEVIGPISIKNLGYSDAAWRTDTSGIAFYTDTTLNTSNPLEKNTVNILSKALKEQLKDDQNSLVFLPLGRGRHIDHTLVRDVGTNLFPNVIYYSDFPYSNKFENENEFISTYHLEEAVYESDQNSKKRQAIWTYVTQREALFNNNKNFMLPDETFYYHMI